MRLQISTSRSYASRVFKIAMTTLSTTTTTPSTTTPVAR
jgi:hypothetical protein